MSASGGGPRQARRSAIASDRTIELDGHTFQARNSGVDVPIRLGGIVETCRFPSARFAWKEKVTRSDAATTRDVSDSIASEVFGDEGADAERHSPIRERATHGRMAIATTSTARSCRTADRLT
jgi:hypothetical protein